MGKLKDKLIQEAEYFALTMAQLLFEIRIESDAPYGDDDNPVPLEFALRIIDAPEHIVLIKKRIEASVLEAITANPDLYRTDGKYSYHPDCFDHAMAIDAYIDELHMETVMKTVIVCDVCGSDNVQSKAWVRPNQGNAFVDLMTDEVQDNHCDDCNAGVSTTSVEKSMRSQVIGFQVVDADVNMHPHMDASFCLYNLEQARSMLDDDNQGDEQWELLAIWTGEVEEPTFMFELGELRDVNSSF